MMLRLCTVLAIATLFSGCSVDVTDESAPEEAGPVEPNEAAAMPHWVEEGPGDLCATGEWVQIQEGFWVNVPVFCAPEEDDRGDPEPMDAIGAPSIQEQSPQVLQ